MKKWYGGKSFGVNKEIIDQTNAYLTISTYLIIWIAFKSNESLDKVYRDQRRLGWETKLSFVEKPVSHSQNELENLIEGFWQRRILNINVVITIYIGKYYT